MIKANLIAEPAGAFRFSYAQYAGWNLFDRKASAVGARSSGNPRSSTG